MDLGMRIRQARLDQGLSQRQLCGKVITRNMLSLIESGKARPGMDTLAYLAQRLGKPVSWFLEEQTVTSPNQQSMDAARKFYTQQEYRSAVEELENYRGPDGVFDAERWLLEALSLMELARQALAQRKDAYARALLEKAAAAGANSPYYTGALERQRLLLLYRAAPQLARELVHELPELSEELLLRAQAVLQAGEFARCAEILDAAQVRGADWHYLRGQAAMGQKDFAGAAEFLHRAEQAYPMECAGYLERCYRELEDYKMAYEYACKQR